ncbi:MAG: hypothetical protein SFY81_10775 [Verrucomicrobiota bacterium]|nr:hypothetical protein [Verrucomicrobiota bacterium]
MKTSNKPPILVLAALGISMGAILLLGRALAADPGITFAPSGTNYLITITNAVGGTSYEIYRRPVLADTNFPWRLYSVGTAGVTNFIVYTEGEPFGFFQASEGVNWDNDGSDNYKDGQPNNGSVGDLQVTIIYPANGSTIN